MTDLRANIHATAIVVGKTGLLFMGPSGSGKSLLAFTCITEAQRIRIPALLVADDQVFISKQAGVVIAEGPPSIQGMIELRGTGLVRLPFAPRATMHYAVLPGSPTGELRLPPDNERVQLSDGIELPAIRLLPNVPLPLAILMARVPEIGR